MEPGLYIVGTPIGNLGDVTLRALETLKEADVIVAEDTRRTRKLLEHYAIKSSLQSCHKFNEAQRAAWVLRAIRDQGRAVALVTNAGMPGVSDPGARLVTACRQAGLPVTVVPGPSAVTAAVAISGLPGQAFHFEGFLPRKKGARKKRLEALGALSAAVILFESPFRVLKLLGEIEEVLGARPLCVARELTKVYEEVLTGDAVEIREAFSARTPKGEFVVVIAPFPDDRGAGAGPGSHRGA